MAVDTGSRSNASVQVEKELFRSRLAVSSFGLEQWVIVIKHLGNAAITQNFEKKPEDIYVLRAYCIDFSFC